MSSSSPAPAVLTEKLCKTFHQGAAPVAATRDLDLAISAGSCVAVMGASGSGKSTLFHLLAGLTAPDSGRVVIAGQDLQALDDEARTRFRRRQLGIVFQAFNLVPVLSARDNVALPLILDGKPRSAALARADALLQEVGLAERATHLPDNLSGGEQQRVAIARALVAEASLILADEATGNLDSQAAERVLQLLIALPRQHGRTLVMITHDAQVACHADRVLVLADGRLCGSLSGAQLASPAVLSEHYLQLLRPGAAA